jgi:hypothetical protein
LSPFAFLTSSISTPRSLTFIISLVGNQSGNFSATQLWG